MPQNHDRLGRAITLRDHALRHLQANGRPLALADADSKITMWIWKAPPWCAVLNTPFANWPSAGDAESFADAAARKQTPAALPYCLSLSVAGKEVLGVEWADDGKARVDKFKRGIWEMEFVHRR
jgi:hypothetical protein